MDERGRKRVNKHMVAKIVQSAELTNRIKEENQMWKQHKATEQDESPKKKRKKESKKDKKTVKRKKRREQSPDLSEEDTVKCEVTRTINTGVQQNERWGHAGYMELYPGEVISGKQFDSSGRSSDSSEWVEKKVVIKKKKRKHKGAKHKKKNKL